MSCPWLRIRLEIRQRIACCAFPWATIFHFSDVLPRWTVPTRCRSSSCCGPPEIRLWLSSTYPLSLTSLLAYSSCLTSLTSGSFQIRWLLHYALQSPSQAFLGFAVVKRTLNETPAAKIHQLSAPTQHTSVLQQTPVPPPKPQGLARRALRETCNHVEDRFISKTKLQHNRTTLGKGEQLWRSLSPRRSRVSPAMCLLARCPGTPAVPWHDSAPCLLRKTMAEAQREGTSGLHALPVPQVRSGTFSVPI